MILFFYSCKQDQARLDRVEVEAGLQIFVCMQPDAKTKKLVFRQKSGSWSVITKS